MTVHKSCPGETTASCRDVDAVSHGWTNDSGSGQAYLDRCPPHVD